MCIEAENVENSHFDFYVVVLVSPLSTAPEDVHSGRDLVAGISWTLDFLGLI